MNKKAQIIRISIILLCSAIAIAVPMTIPPSLPIIITSDMSDGEILSHVELSDGELRFKNREELLAQLKPEDFVSAKGTEYYNPLEDIAVPYYELNGGKEYSREDILDMMNIHPEHWQVGSRTLSGSLEFYRNGNAWFGEPITFINGDKEHPMYGDSCFLFVYQDEGSSARISAAPAPVKWLGSIVGSDFILGSGMVSVRSAYGDMDSRIGDVNVSIKTITDPHATYFDAFFVIEQTVYLVSASDKDVSQEEFVKLLISICEAPHSEKENLIDLLLNS